MISVSKPLADPAHTLYLVDISSFIFRAFYAIRPLHNRAGEPTNAIYGVATMLARLVDEAKPEHLAVVYDSKEPSFRKEIYPEYKANRSAPPEDLIPQFDRIEQLIRSLRFPSFRQSGVEADDLIATLTHRWIELSPLNRVVIVSSDKDLMQLIGPRVNSWDTMSGKVYGIPEVEEKFGVGPDLVRDYLGLVGDSSDNIPGVPGVGPKTATDLLKKFGSMQGVLAAAAQGQIPGKKGEGIHANREKALLSAELASLKDKLEVSVSFEEMSFHFAVTPECVSFLKEMDFHSLAERWANAKSFGAPAKESVASPSVLPIEPVLGAQPVSEAEAAPEKLPFYVVQTETQLAALVTILEKGTEFGFDLETTSLNPRVAELVGIAICPDESASYYIPVGHTPSLAGGVPDQLSLDLVLGRLRPFIENSRYKKIGQNLKYDWSVLIAMGLKPSGIGADTMVAAYVLNPHGRHNLETLAAQYLGYTTLSFEQVCGKGKDALTFDQIPVDLATRYSAEDAWIAVRLWNVLLPKLKELNLLSVFAKIDLPLVEVLSRMELQGVCIDLEWLQKLSREFGEEIKGIEEKIATYTSGPVNLNSPKQLAHLLFEELKLPVQGKTKTGFSTDADVLHVLAPLHEVPRLLLEYREISKLKGTYVDPLPQLRDPKDGKIHASFHQAVTATGRLSSSDPNLQNIPIRSERGKKIRRAFIPSPGSVLISADYSQIELRILAHMSADEELCRSFNADEDVHRRTASEIFGIPPEAVDDRSRGIAKAINFGLMYGKSAFALAQELSISRKEAQSMIDRYFERYRGVKAYLDGAIRFAHENGYVATEFGRRRDLPEIHSKNQAIRNSAERMAMNTPIQGTAADLMKLAMIELDLQLREGAYGAQMIVQVHDEVLLDCPKDEAEKVERLMVDVLESAMKLRVPLRVNSATGASWIDL